MKEILIKAKSLIDTPEKLSRDYNARDKAGREVDTFSSDAVCFCSIGAIYRATKDLGYDATYHGGVGKFLVSLLKL